MKRMLAPALLTMGALTLAACSSSESSPSTPQANAQTDTVITVAFYPLQYLASEVVGDIATVDTLTAPGVEPHDLELSPNAVRKMRESDIVLYLSDFQPAVDLAVKNLEDTLVIDVAPFVSLLPVGGGDAHEHDDDDHDHGDYDPHFWLDPERLASIITPLTEALSEQLPDFAADFDTNGERVHSALSELASSYSQGLQSCERDTIVVSHEAFNYITAPNGLHQAGLSGVNPDAEPSPATLRSIRALIDETGITTIFFENLVDSTAAKSFAADVGVGTAVLDPLEGLTDSNDTYITVMERNLDTLREALNCA